MKPVILILAMLAPMTPIHVHAEKPLITEVDLSLVTVEGLKLGMTQDYVRELIQQKYNIETNTQFLRAGVQCDKQQCTATAVGADLQEILQLQFNTAGALNWISLQRRSIGGSSPEDCLVQAEQQLEQLRQQYSPNNHERRFRQHSVSLMLNKLGHPDPAENSLYGFRALIKCDPLAKGEAQIEFELRDSNL